MIAWFTRHSCNETQLAALQALYGSDVKVIPQAGDFDGAEALVQAMHRLNATDCVLVAPLSVFDALCKRGVHPLRGVMDGRRFVEFRRVTGLELQFEAVERQ